MNKNRVLQHPDVSADLMNVIDLNAENAGTGVALRKLEEVETTLRSLAQTPHIGSFWHDIFQIRALSQPPAKVSSALL